MSTPRRTPETSLWEAAYLRFETPEEEVDKFTRRLQQVGADGWSRHAQIVELFCGRGNGVVALERLGFRRVNGIDLSITLLQQSHRRGRFCVADCRVLPLQATSHDIAIIHGGLHHLRRLPDDLGGVLAEVQRILRPGGVFVAIEPWLTPILSVVHRVSSSKSIRRLWPKLDALGTLIEHESDTYSQWLDQPNLILSMLSASFVPRIQVRRWGKLTFVGENRSATM